MAKKAAKKQSSQEKQQQEHVARVHRNLRRTWISLIIVLIIVFDILMIIANKQNPCAKLDTQTEKDNCYFEIGIENGYVDYCKKVENEALSDSCVAEIGINKSDVTFCEDLNNQSKGYCLKNIAETTESPDTCAQIKDTFWRNNCHWTLAHNLEDFRLCREMIRNFKMEQDCLYNYALEYETIQPCYLVKNFTLKDTCVIRAAVLEDNATLCNKAKRSEMKDICWQHFGIETDAAYCDNISSSLVRESCYKHTNRTIEAN